MKVLMISTDRSIFEKGSVAFERMADYARLVDELHIIIFSKRIIPHPEQLQISDNASVYPTNSKSRWLYMVDGYRLGKYILQSEIKNLQSIISCQDTFETGLVGALLKRRFGIPFQIQIHTDFLSPYFKAQSLLNRLRILIACFVLKRANAIRVVSDRIKASLLKSAIINHKSKIAVLPIFVNSEKFSAPGTKDLKTTTPFRQTFLIVSRLTPEKNVALAIRTFAKIADRFPDTGLLIVGVGSEETRLRRLIKAFGVEKRVVFVGAVPNDRLASFYRGTYCMLATSNYEGYGMALVEAASAGVPIVTTDVGIVGEVLRDGENALVCPVGDEACLVDRLGSVLADESLRQRLGEAATRAARDHTLTKEQYLDKMREGWQQCLASVQL